MKIIFFYLILYAITHVHGDYKNSEIQFSYYSQQIDQINHGNLSSVRFAQRYYVDSTYWVGPSKNGSILVFLGGEGSVENWVGGIGIMNMAAPVLKSLVVYIEHRFYGHSIPFGDIDLAMADPEVRGCLTSQQALADFAELIVSLKTNMSSIHSPVIVVGGSYAGMLAAWFRLKYPHIIIGALASSAPIFNFEDLSEENQYCYIASRDFQDTSRKCHRRIKQSWKLIDDIAAQPHGLQTLGQIFKLCSPLDSAEQLKTYLRAVYNYAAQYGGRFNNFIKGICKHIDNALENDILGGISRATSSINDLDSCIPLDKVDALNPPNVLDPQSVKAWNWQLCTELISHRRCEENHITMFEPEEYNFTQYDSYCWYRYGVHIHSDAVQINYGGQDMVSTLKGFGSNIIFSNGLKDPLSGSSVLKDISDTIVAITTEEGAHCMDLYPLQRDDPKWLKHQRQKELKILKQWLNNFYAFTPNSGNRESKAPNILLIWLAFFVVLMIY